MRQLPDELILQIIAFLEPSELVKLQHVSRQFLNLARDKKLWKTLCFDHSSAERRRRRLEITFTSPPAETDPRLAELIEAANSLADTFDITVHNPHAEAQLNRNRERKRAALLNNWDPSGLEEKVNWYQEFVQRHAPPQVSWFQDAGHEEEDEIQREATGAGILFDSDGLASKLIAPLDDGSIKIWDVCARNPSIGRSIATSEPGLLSNRGPDLDHDTRLTQSQAIMTETGAVEGVSIDSAQQRAFFAVQNTLNQVDLRTLQIVSRTPYPFPITALSEAHHSTPLTIGTNWTLHLHDTRKPPSLPSSSRVELLNASTTPTSFPRLSSGDFGGHVSLSQPGALSIAHMPSHLGDGNGDIWVSGRFTSLLNFDRRFFPRLRGTVHSGARISCLTTIPHPFIPNSLRLGPPYSAPSLLRSARETRGITLVAAGEYKGKGSLELYSLSPSPAHSITSTDSRTTRNPAACYQNRQTASASRLLSVAPHGTRLVFSDANGALKWLERDATTPVRTFNINEHTSSPTDTPNTDGDIVQKILPTTSPSLLSPYAPSSAPELGTQNLVLWTGDGKLGMLGFGHEGVFDVDTFEDAVERQEEGVGVKDVEREYGVEMRRALEAQARELRWLRGYGL